MKDRIAVLVVTILGLSGCSLAPGESELERAEALRRAARYDESIAAYEAHMRRRLTAAQRPEWENPYFYLLIIGDLHLYAGRIPEALAAYESAEEHGVEAGLVADRFRFVGSYLEQHNRLDEALELMQRYRDRDPLLFDGMLDRIAREKVRREDETAP